MKKHLHILILILLTGFLYQSVNACTITETPLRKQFRKADAVFIGKVLKIIEYNPSEKDVPLVPENWRDWKIWSKVTFEVEKKWKGDITKTQEFISVAYFICGCSTTVSKFIEGENYLIFSEGKSFVFVCNSNESDSEYAKAKIKHIDNLGFRVWSRIYPF